MSPAMPTVWEVLILFLKKWKYGIAVIFGARGCRAGVINPVGFVPFRRAQLWIISWPAPGRVCCPCQCFPEGSGFVNGSGGVSCPQSMCGFISFRLELKLGFGVVIQESWHGWGWEGP